jgi:small subunit ribosomal protein S3
MSHTVHPYSHRLGIIRDWKSRWFATDNQFVTNLKVDVTIREFLEKRLRGYYISSVEIERAQKSIRVILRTSRPGMVIGRSGEGVTKLKTNLLKTLKKENLISKEEFRVDIEEIRSPESSAHIVSQMVAEALEKRMPFRRVLKQTVEKVMANRDVKGVRIALAGRLGGS